MCMASPPLPSDSIQTHLPGAAQEFGHPQARFLHEKRWHLPAGAQAALAPVLGAINRATFAAIDSAMFIGTVGRSVHASPRTTHDALLPSGPHCLGESGSTCGAC